MENKLLKYSTRQIANNSSFLIEAYPTNLPDNDYIAFLESNLTGFFFSDALHLYGLSEDIYHSIFYINSFLTKTYEFLLKEDLFFFGCDLFGNQFAYVNNEICMFNIETGERELIASNFNKFLDILIADRNYYTGESILIQWNDLMIPVDFKQRLVPIKPFVIGGEYSPNNMRAVDFFETLSYNASIARQIYDLPDGTDLEIIIK
jgi:hypothetical protein